MQKVKKPRVRGILNQQLATNPINAPTAIMTNDMVSVCGALYRVLGIQGDKAIVDMGGTPTPLPLEGLHKSRSCVVPPRGSKTRLA